MRIDLNSSEVKKILSEKFGEGSFRIFHTESDNEYEGRTGEKISELKATPTKITVVINL
jgi:hypothetical protein